jgi:intracellular multiplication protein IcmD
MLSKLRSKGVLKACAFILLVLCASMAFAETKDVGGVAKNVFEALKPVGKLLVYGSYIAGIGFAIAAMLKFKAHKDNPTQVPLGTPIAFLFIAGGLMFLPGVMTTAGGTLFGSDAQSAAEAAKNDGSDFLN